MKATEILSKAEEHMLARASQYDQEEGERSMLKTVTAFNAITGNCMTEAEGWLFMVTLKQVRLFTNLNQPSKDSCEDAVAYSALLAECCTETGMN